MKILILSTFFPPLQSIASLRPYSWAKHWASMGHDVTVLTTEKEPDQVTLPLDDANFTVIEIPSGKWLKKLKKNYQSSPSQKTTKSLFQRFRQRTGVLNACRMPDLTDLWRRQAWKWVKSSEKSWDLVISTCGPYPVHLLGRQIKRKGFAKQWITDYRDLWSNSYLYPGLFPFNQIERILERRCLRDVDLITTVSDGLADSLRTIHHNKRIEVIENGFNADDFPSLPQERIFPNDGKIRLVYTGTIHPHKQNPSPLFQAIAALAKDQPLPQLELIFVGADLGGLSKLTEKYQVEQWVSIRGVVERTKALQMQRDADVLLFFLLNDDCVEGAFSGKLFEYLISKTPIIAIGAQTTDCSQRLIEQVGAGITLGCDVEKIKRWLIDLLEGKQPLSYTAKEELLQRYERKYLAEKLLTFVTE